MKKAIRELAQLGLICLVIGGVLTAAGFFLGGQFINAHITWRNGPRVVWQTAAGTSATASDSNVPTGDIDRLVVDISAAKVTVETGDAFDLQVSGTTKYESDLSGDTWTIRYDIERWHTGADTPRFVITLPAGAELQEAELNIGAGTLTAKGLHSEEARLTVGAGEMTLSDCAVEDGAVIDVGMGTLTWRGGLLEGDCDIRCGMGQIDMDIARPAQFGYAVDCGMGSVTVDGRTFAGMATQAEAGNAADAYYDINCGMGEVTIQFS